MGSPLCHPSIYEIQNDRKGYLKSKMGEKRQLLTFNLLYYMELIKFVPFGFLRLENVAQNMRFQLD